MARRPPRRSQRRAAPRLYKAPRRSSGRAARPLRARATSQRGQILRIVVEQPRAVQQFAPSHLGVGGGIVPVTRVPTGRAKF